MSRTKQRYGVVVGFDYHARYLASVINRYSENWRLQAFPSTRRGTLQALWALRKADMLVAFGGPGPSVALAEAAQLRSVPVCVVWAGSDVMNAATKPFELAVVKRRGYDNVAVARWLVDELRPIGVEATQLDVAAIDVDETLVPLPAAFRVLTYLPEPRRSFYGRERVYEIARAVPHIDFSVLGTGGSDAAAPANVTFAGYVNDVPRRIDTSTVLLRLTEHDGTSVLVLEALARGRHVVWTHDFPCVHAAADTADALEAIRRFAQAHADGTLAPNLAGRDYVRDHFAPSDVALRFETHLNAVVAKRSRLRNGKTRRVAISGLGLFSAEVAKQMEQSHPEWKTEVLWTSSRLEVAAAMLSLARADLWYSIGSPITDRWVDLWARVLRKPRVIHWVGSDIEYFKTKPNLWKRLRAKNFKHLTEVNWTSVELAELGMQSEIVPLPLRHQTTGVTPLPNRFTIMLYLPAARPEFYGRKAYESLLRDFAAQAPRVLVVGGGTLEAPDGMEVVNLGWLDDLREAYERSTVLIRLTPRDGLSLMVLEALSYGRHVMWSKPFPHVTHVSGKDDIVEGLRSLFAAHHAGTLKPQYDAAEMVERRYSNPQSLDRILQAWESVR